MNILCLSTSSYYPFPTRKQNVMNRLVDANIIYVNPAVSLIAPFKDPKAKEEIKKYKEAPIQAMKHIWVYSQPPVIPFFNKKRFINELNQKRLAKYLASIINRHGFGKDFWVWCYSPTSADVIAPLAKAVGISPAVLWSRTIYDCVDRHSAYPGMIDPLVVDAMEEDLARSAKCVFATAQGLYQRLSLLNPNTHLVPNGANYELFFKAAGLNKKTKEEKIRCPHFGFVGMLQECIDTSLIEDLARAFPKGKISIVGRTLPGVDTSWMAKYENVEYLGLLPQEKLPELIRTFDVCLNLFKDNDLSKDVSPLKFYEYLATGKPIVSTPVPLQVLDYKSCIYIAENREDFLTKCKEALYEESGSTKETERIKQGKLCSWDARVNTMKQILGW